MREQKGARFLFITDLHARNRAPKMRKDDYRKALIDKLSWVCEATKTYNTSNVILCGGDVFDVPKVNLDVADDLVDVFVKHDCVLKSIFGNHDLENSLASAPSVVLGHMMRRASEHVGALPVLGAKPYLLKQDEYTPIQVWGHHYKYQNHTDHLYVDAPYSYPKVIISHSMLLKYAPNWGEENYTLFEDLNTNANLVLVGHYHPQQPITRLNNPYSTQVAGPGALMRGALSRDDITRMPSMAMVEWNQEAEDFIVEYIPIACAAPAEEIFRIQEAQEVAKYNDSMDAFREELQDLQVQCNGLTSILEAISATEGIDQVVKEEALRRLGVETASRLP